MNSNWILHILKKKNVQDIIARIDISSHIIKILRTKFHVDVLIDFIKKLKKN